MRNSMWSEPENNNLFTYSNQFGEVVLERVTDFMPVSEITREKVPQIEEVLVSVDCAEKVVLITENRRMAIAFLSPIGDVERSTYAVKYSCPSRAAVCRVTVKSFRTPGGLSAREQIEDMAPRTCGPLPVL